MWARGREERREKVAASGRKNSVGAGEPGGLQPMGFAESNTT